MALGKIKIQGGKIKAPRIGLCSNDIKIEKKSRISANFRGCAADYGKGNVQRKTSCSGAGGAHGGTGGNGSSQVTSQFYQDKCKTIHPLPYYKGKEARFEGSGGTSGDSKSTSGSGMAPGKHGGSGGGIVWITTPKIL